VISTDREKRAESRYERRLLPARSRRLAER
jgi:hypothetical protein